MTTAVIFAFGLAAASQDQGDVGTASSQSTLLWTTILGFLSLLATQGFALWREYRNRKWDLYDREVARQEMREKVEAQRLETIATAIQLAKTAKIQHARIVDKIEQNTALTQQVGEKAEAAYEAGNNFNERLESLRKELFGREGQIDHIEAVSDDTNVKVTELKEEVTAKEKEGRP